MLFLQLHKVCSSLERTIDSSANAAAFIVRKLGEKFSPKSYYAHNAQVEKSEIFDENLLMRKGEEVKQLLPIKILRGKIYLWNEKKGKTLFAHKYTQKRWSFINVANSHTQNLFMKLSANERNKIFDDWRDETKERKIEAIKGD